MNIILTGANGNLGRTVCRYLEKEGHFIEAALGPGSPLKFESKRVFPEEADLLNEKAVEDYVGRVMRRRRSVHAAVLLAGGFGMGSIENTDGKTLDEMIGLNFRTAHHLVRPLLRHFRASGGGRFVFIASRPVFDPKEGRALFGYALSKAMLVQMAHMINAEDAKLGISAAVIAPSIIDTAPNRRNMPDANPEDWVPPQRIAEAIGYLISESGLMLHDPIFKIYNKA